MIHFQFVNVVLHEILLKVSLKRDLAEFLRAFETKCLVYICTPILNSNVKFSKFAQTHKSYVDRLTNGLEGLPIRGCVEIHSNRQFSALVD